MSTKDRVLKKLEETRGSYVSGMALAEECRVSRNAVWKAINDLRAAGYPIESANNRGYCLVSSSDIISRQGIEMYLGDKAVAGIYVFDEIDSTNTEAKRRLLYTDDILTDRTVIVARRQTGGRGHTSGGFSSPEGGIYLSIILRAEEYLELEEPITERSLGGVSSVLKELLGQSIRVESDSSIYIGADKVCGILTEGICDLETGVFSNYIIGIGVRLQSIIYDHSITKNQIIAEIIRSII